MEDLISRDMAIAFIRELYRLSDGNVEEDDVISVLEHMLPANRWILCEKRLPEEHENPLMARVGMPNPYHSDNVLVTFIDESVVKGEKQPYKGDRYVEHGVFRNGEVMNHYMVSKCIPVAWMNYPAPYVATGDSNEKTD